MKAGFESNPCDKLSKSLPAMIANTFQKNISDEVSNSQLLIRGSGTSSPNQCFRYKNMMDQISSSQPLVNESNTPLPDQCLRYCWWYFLTKLVVASGVISSFYWIEVNE